MKQARHFSQNIKNAVLICLLLCSGLVPFVPAHAQSLSQAPSQTTLQAQVKNTAPEITVATISHGEVISNRFEYFVEKRPMALEEIVDIPPQQWQITGANPSFGPTKQVYWFRSRLSFPEGFHGKIYQDRPHLDEVDIHVLYNSGERDDYQVGDSRPFHNKPIAHHHTLIPIDAKPGESVDYYIRINSHGTPLQLEVRVFDESSFWKYDRKLLLWHGFYFGAVLIIVFYNLFLFLSVRESQYLYYIGHTLGYAMAVGLLTGHFHQYIFPDHPRLNSELFGYITPLGRIFGCLFALRSLQLFSRLPVIAYLFCVLIAIDVICMAVAPFVVYGTLAPLFVVTFIAVYPLCVLTGLYLWVKGYKDARFFFFAWLALYTGTMIYCLNMAGVFSWSPWFMHFFLASHLVEAILLALSLADRLNIAKENELKIQRMKEEASRHAERVLKTENELMRSKIAQVETEQKANQAKLESQARGEFIANMSHEVRTPMNGVLGMAELLKETPLDTSQRRLLSIIEESGNSLLEVINDILDYSKINAGKMSIEKIDVDLEALLDNCTEVFSLQCMEKKLNFALCVKPHTPLLIKTDPTRLRQILVNLISNALKFTQQGEVTVRVSSHIDANVRDYLLFKICDTGIGISEEQQKHLFQGFAQASSSTSREFGGTGLGLSICKKLVSLMNGKIGVESRQGHGSCFSFTIPYEPATPEFIPKTPFYKLQLAGKRLLIIDNDKTFSEFTSVSAQNWGINAIACETANQGFQQLADADKQGNSYDLVMIDVGTSDFDAVHLAQAILNLQLQVTPKFVFVSALHINPQAASDTKLKSLAAVPLLEKPIAQSHLRENLAIAMGAAEPQLPVEKIYPTELLRNIKLLVTEDNKVNRMVIMGQLERLGIQADIAEDGYEALDKVAKNGPYDIILMDCDLPGIDGFETTKQIRNLEAKNFPGNSDSHILALTASTSPEIHAKAQEAGMNEVLLKPLSLDSLETHLLEQHTLKQSAARKSA